MPKKRSKRNGKAGAGVGKAVLQQALNFIDFVEKECEGTLSGDETAKPPTVREEGEDQTTRDAAKTGVKCERDQHGAFKANMMALLSDYNEMEKIMSDIVPNGGIKKFIDRRGDGVKAPPKAKVYINYKIFVEGSTQPVDITYIYNCYAFKFDNPDVLSVLDLGVRTMEVKEVALFLTEPFYAYGAVGLPNKVPPDCRALFIIKFEDFVDDSTVGPIFPMTMTFDPRTFVNFEEIYKTAIEMKVKGNECCLSGDWTGAKLKYRKGISILERYVTSNDEVEKRKNDLLFILYTNLAQCHLQTKVYELVVSMCHCALDLPPRTQGNRCKAYYRLAKAEYELGRISSSLEHCRKALELEPNNPDARTLMEQLNRGLEADEEEERKLMEAMLAWVEHS